MSSHISGFKTSSSQGGANGIGLGDLHGRLPTKVANCDVRDIDGKRDEMGVPRMSRQHAFSRRFAARLDICDLVSLPFDGLTRSTCCVNASRQFLTTDALDGDDTSVLNCAAKSDDRDAVTQAVRNA